MEEITGGLGHSGARALCGAFSRPPCLPGRARHREDVGVIRMGRLPAQLPATMSAADDLRRSAGPAQGHRHAVVLMLTRAAVVRRARAGGHAGVPSALVRELVIITGRG